jgi:uncharacterized protein YmfQ (DUF2313 family)
MARPWNSADTDYRDLLARLLPRGMVWVRDTASRLHGLQWGLGAELSRIHNRVIDLADEVDPTMTTEILEDWERQCDLYPSDLPNEAQRRRAIHGHLLQRGGQNPAYYREVAETVLGAEIEIGEPFAADCESDCEAAVWNQEWYVATCEGDCEQPLDMWGWAHLWIIYMPDNHHFVATCEGDCEQPLDWWSDLGMELWRLIDEIKPAHTIIIYSEEELNA